MLAMLTMMLVIQDVPGPPADDAVVAQVPLTQRRCVRSNDEILVCGGVAESQRIRPLPEPGARQVFGPAAVRLSPNKRAALRAENSANPTVSAPRMMLDFTIDF